MWLQRQGQKRDPVCRRPEKRDDQKKKEKEEAEKAEKKRSTRKAKGKDSDDKEPEEAERPKRKRKCDDPAFQKDEKKARYSRKSMAYVRAKKAALREGCDMEEATKRAKEATYIYIYMCVCVCSHAMCDYACDLILIFCAFCSSGLRKSRLTAEAGGETN